MLSVDCFIGRRILLSPCRAKANFLSEILKEGYTTLLNLVYLFIPFRNEGVPRGFGYL